MIPAAVKLSDLIELVWVSGLVTLTLVTAFAIGIRGSARATDLRREGRTGAATAHGALAVACYALVGAAMIAGIGIIAAG